jgi:hypothetical protein
MECVGAALPFYFYVSVITTERFLVLHHDINHVLSPFRDPSTNFLPRFLYKNTEFEIGVGCRPINDVGLQATTNSKKGNLVYNSYHQQ